MQHKQTYNGIGGLLCPCFATLEESSVQQLHQLQPLSSNIIRLQRGSKCFDVATYNCRNLSSF